MRRFYSHNYDFGACFSELPQKQKIESIKKAITYILSMATW
jgi:hypothetical protein